MASLLLLFSQVEIISEDLDWYISQAGDDIHLIEKFECEDAYDLYEALSLDELAAPGAPPVVKGTKKLEVEWGRIDISNGGQYYRGFQPEKRT